MTTAEVQGGDGRLKQFVIFQVDTHEEESISLAYAQITQFGHLEVTCLKIKVEINPQPESYTHSTKIDSFWTKTYQSNADLPKRLFQMKMFQKLMEYFKDEKMRLIQTQQRTKNDKKKLLFKLWIQVTKNITDFVPLQLELIDPDMIHYFVEADSTIFDHIHRKTLSILQQRRIKKLHKQQEIRNTMEEKQKSRQEKSSSEHHYTVVEEIQEGQMASSQIGYGSVVNSHDQHFEGKQKYNWNCSESNQHENNSNSDVNVDCGGEKNEVQEKTYYEESKQSMVLLKEQYVESLENKNQLLLERVLELQLELVKKNIKLDIYEDPFSNLNNIELMVEKKCKKRVQNYYKAINSLMIMFQDLKKFIHSHQHIEQSSSKMTVNEPKEEGQITTEKNLNRILSKIENAFEEFY